MTEWGYGLRGVVTISEVLQ